MVVSKLRLQIESNPILCTILFIDLSITLLQISIARFILLRISLQTLVITPCKSPYISRIKFHYFTDLTLLVVHQHNPIRLVTILYHPCCYNIYAVHITITWQQNGLAIGYNRWLLYCYVYFRPLLVSWLGTPIVR